MIARPDPLIFAHAQLLHEGRLSNKMKTFKNPNAAITGAKTKAKRRFWLPVDGLVNYFLSL